MSLSFSASLLRRTVAQSINPSFCRTSIIFQHSLAHDTSSQCQLNNIEQLTSHSLNTLISSCAKSASPSLGKQAHSATIKLGYQTNVFIATALVDFYSKCDEISNAEKMFDEMPERNIVTWNSLISGYLRAQFSTQAFRLFTEMLRIGFTPTPYTFSSVLVSCAQLEAEQLGVQVHGLSLKYGFTSNVVVGTASVDMYSKCLNINDSRKCFDEIQEKNVITWTTMVSGYTHNGKPHEAMIVVREMRCLGIILNKVSYNSVLSSFSSPNELSNARQIHCLVIQEGVESDEYIVVTLLTMYGRCGCLEDFYKIYVTVSGSDPILRNSVIAGFSYLGKDQEALACFRRMRMAGIAIDFYTLTNILKAIGVLSALEEGKQLHALVVKYGYALSLYVQNGLVSMYARCGTLGDSKQAFSSIDEPDLISWNSLLSACAQHGYGEEVVELFEKMRGNGIKQDQSTFLSVLTACSHAGLLDLGLHYFDLMRDALAEPPRSDHYACIVDLLGRSGHLEEAESFIKNMPIVPGPSVYKALLSACRLHENMDIATRSAIQLLKLWPNDPATYILLSSVFAKGGYWDEAAEAREVLCERGVMKKPGCSWVDVSRNMQEEQILS